MPNYFDLLGLVPQFDMDPAVLESAYFKAQRESHPDRFVGKPEKERHAAMQRSVDVNRAYRTLKEPLSRAQYLLSLHNIRVGTESDSVKPSQAMLIEAMEMREQPPQISTLVQMIEQSITSIGAHYTHKKFDAMAQETLRLGYLLKARHVILRRAEGESAGSSAIDGDPAQSLRASQDDKR